MLVDANLLIRSVNLDDPLHERAAGWFERTLNTAPRVGLAWPSLLAFLRITTNPRVFKPALAVADAWAHVEEWLDVDGVWVPEPTPLHQKTLGRLLSDVKVGANLVPDAHLAALAIEHGLVLHTTDTDFAAFAGLRWSNPLAQPPSDD